ncbi:CPBP family intramembrane glutamic endopeptidase [Actinomycetospora sp. C-140]
MSTPTQPADPGPVPPGPTDPGPASGAPERPRPGWTEIAVGAVAYLALTALAAILLGGLLRPGSAALSVVAIGISGAAALGAALLAVAVRVRSLPAIGVRAASWRWLLVGVAGGVVGFAVNRVIIIGYVLATGDMSNPQAGFLPGLTGDLPTFALMMLLGAVLVPVGEELLFRGVVTTALGRYGAGVAVLASALVFALAHGVSIVLPAAFVLGVVNALLLRRSGSVWPGVLAHGVNNALVFGLAAIVL